MENRHDRQGTYLLTVLTSTSRLLFFIWCLTFTGKGTASTGVPTEGLRHQVSCDGNVNTTVLSMKCVIVFYDPWKGSASQGEMDPGIWDFPLFRMSRASLGCPSCQYPDNDRMTLSDSCCLCAAQVGPMQTACLAACQVCPWGGMDGRKLKNIEKRSVFWKLVVYLI